MPQITADDVVKTFRVAERRPGLVGALTGVVIRRHRTVMALNRVSFSIEKGDLVGYIGPNGAGKSTTVKILSGILVPDSGNVVVDGRVPWKDRVQHAAGIGVVFGQRTQLWWDLPVIESFELLRDIYRVGQADYRRNIDELVGMLGLAPFLDTPVRQLSLGQRMRCDLAASLLHGPEILFLDEPTIGLDASAKLAVRKFIEDINRERGVTVILTTHDMDDIETLCRRIIVIDDGGILLDGDIADIRRKVTVERRLIIDLEDEEAEVRLIPDTSLVSRNGRRLILAFDPDEKRADELISSIASSHSIKDLFVENPPIEKIVSRLYREVRS